MQFGHKPPFSWSYDFLVAIIEISIKKLHRMMGSNIQKSKCSKIRKIRTLENRVSLLTLQCFLMKWSFVQCFLMKLSFVQCLRYLKPIFDTDFSRSIDW